MTILYDFNACLGGSSSSKQQQQQQQQREQHKEMSASHI